MRKLTGLQFAVISTLVFLPVFTGLSDRVQAQTCTTAIGMFHLAKVDGRIRDVKFDQDCNFIYATNESFNRLEVYNLKSLSFESPIPVGPRPAGFDFDPTGSVAYIANFHSASISIIDLESRTETSRIFVGDERHPNFIAVANSGLVLFSTSHHQDTIMQMDPARDYEVRVRDDYPWPYGRLTYLNASGDRSAIGIAVRRSLPALVSRYDAAYDTFVAREHLNISATGMALDKTGDTMFLGGRQRSAVLDSTFTPLGYVTRLGGGEGYVVAISPDGARGYQLLGDSYAIEYYNTKEFVQIGYFNVGDKTTNQSDRLAISSDGSLLAIPTVTGFSIVRATGNPPNQNVVVFSSAQEARQSFIRLFNADTKQRHFIVNLHDFDTGEWITQWMSGYISPKTSLQYSIGEIEGERGLRLVEKPDKYLLTVKPGVPGAFSHVLWQPMAGVLTNLSTCYEGTDILKTRLINVHTSVLDAGYPSTVVITNSGDTDSSVTLEIFDSKRRILLGTHEIPSITAGAGIALTMNEIEVAADIPVSDDRFHYNIEIAEEDFTGYLQHFVYNQKAGVVTDMTAVCTVQ